jgi:hypothetical protein
MPVERDVNKRWEQGTPHHPESIKIAEALRKIDWASTSPILDLEFGGDGDNGEALLFMLDIYFECRDSGEPV